MDAVEAAFMARDWDALPALCVQNPCVEDRRHHARVSGGRDWWIGDVRLIATEVPGASYRRHLVGTAGPHIAVERVLWSGAAGPANGSFEIEYLWLSEVDDTGRIIAMAAIDLADQAAAVQEAQERWLARDAAAASVMRPVLEMGRGMAVRDVARVRAVLADHLVVQDHRPSRLGTIHGGDAYAERLAALWQLAPDTHLDVPVGPLVWDARGCVGILHTAGTFPSGGSFETDLAVLSIVEGGRITRLEYFDADDVGAALARFEALRPRATAGAA
jgi:ketosteroid isomerase-like protein